MNDDDDKRMIDEIALSLMEVLSSVLGQMNNQFPSDVFVEIQEGEKETIVLFQIPGVEEEILKLDILKKKDVEHVEMEGDYKILRLTSRRYGETFESGIKIPEKIKKIKDFSIKNGIIEIILV